MKVREMGEQGLIKFLSQIAYEEGVDGRAKPEMLIGIGDDASVWQGEDLTELSSTDMLVQDIHFNLNINSWRELGWKALAVNISDIAAMGGSPVYALVSLGLPLEIEAEQVGELYRGMAEIARELDITIAGGDISEAPILIISPTIVGKGEKGKLLTRSQASHGDRIAVTGYLGSSAAGLRMLQEGLEFNSLTTSVLRNAHLRPWPRVTEGKSLAQCGVKAGMDISDGLLMDLKHICEESGVEARIRSSDVPVHPIVEEAFGEEGLKFALSGGEDYELLFTAPERIMEEVKRRVPSLISIGGEIVKGEAGKIKLLDKNGREVEWGKEGWEHFRSR